MARTRKDALTERVRALLKNSLMGASDDCNESRNSEDVTESEKIQKDLLWDFYQDARAHARHNETIRSNAINYMLLVASALIVVISLDREICGWDLAFAIILILIGLIGALFAASYAELYYRHRGRAIGLRQRLNTLFFQNQASDTLCGILTEADDDDYKFKWVRLITGEASSTHWFWIGVPLVVCMVGIALTVWAYVNGACPLGSP
jgi:hypothetical protein